jgi:alpha-glucosidase (family GH31 glycosyl hydrolase)
MKKETLLLCVAINATVWAQTVASAPTSAMVNTNVPESNRVTDGNARFTVLTPTLIRTEYAGDGIFETQRSFNIIEHNLPVPAYSTNVNDGYLEIQTEKLLLRYKQNSGIFDSTNLVISLNVEDQPVIAKPWCTTVSAYREEAENARLLGDAWLATDHNNYDGSGFVAGLKAVGAGMEWTVRKNFAAGNYVLSLKYSSGKGAQTISLYIDGVKTQITLPATVDWEEWKLYQQTITLDFGPHTFKLLCDNDDSKNVNIDWITVSPVLGVNRLYEAEDAIMFGGVNKATDHKDFSGSGFAAGYKKAGASVCWELDNTQDAGDYVISLKYSNGIPTDGLHIVRTLSLYVDDVKTQISFNPTSDWEHWDIFQKTTALSTGRHTIRLVGEEGDNLHVNIDWLVVTPVGATLPNEHIDAQKTNLGGWSRGLDTKNGAIPLWDGILSRDGWYLLDDSETALYDSDGWIADRPIHRGGYLDGYFFGYGTDYQTALSDFYKITGNPVLLPKWAFGIWYSINSETYTNASFYQNTLLPRFRSEKLPLDVLVVDTDWKLPERWNGWSWNLSLFPDPQGFMEWTREQGLAIPLNVHPTINNNDPKFTQTNTTAGGLIADGSKHHFDFSKKQHAQAFLDLLQPFNQQGVRFWWNDQAEKPHSEVKGAPADTWINHLYAKDANDRNLRGFAFSRIGSGDIGYNDNREPGIGWSEHRYTLHFTGDAYDTWNMLAFQSTFTIREANIGIPYVSHDLGSYHANQLSNDMYIRWIQFGVFQPIFRLHSKRGMRLPWEYPDVKAQAEKFIRLRHALIPYTYTLAHESANGGLPIVRGMYWYYPTASEAYSYDKQYFYGEKMLVAPIATPGATASTKVWFPEGMWTNFFTNATVTGPAEQNVSADYSSMPVFVKAGGIIPLAHYSDYVGQTPDDSLTLKVYTGNDGEFILYEDEGENLNYQTGEYAQTEIIYREQEKKLSIKARQGSYTTAPEQRAYDIEFYNAAIPEKISVNGVALSPVTADSGEGWWESNGVIYVRLNKHAVTADLDIVFENNTNENNTNVLPVVTEKRGVKLFPNPAKDQVTIEVENANKEFTISIYDVKGEKIFNKLIIDSNQTTVDVYTFSKGIYLVKVNSGNDTFTKKLVIK